MENPLSAVIKGLQFHGLKALQIAIILVMSNWGRKGDHIATLNYLRDQN